MEPHSLLEHYLKAVQEHSDDEQSINRLIDVYYAKYANHPHFQQILEGERFFWQKDYESALKKYLEAKHVPSFEFFCYRASACISEKMGHVDQAVRYAQKALAFYPKDPLAAAICQKRTAAPCNQSQELHDLFTDYAPPQSLFQEEKPCAPPSSAEKAPSSKPSPIGQRLEEFQAGCQKAVEEYREHLELRPKKQENILTVLNGWGKERGMTPSQALRTSSLREVKTGLYIHWNGSGIAINPGRHFLRSFHEAGYAIHDIDDIIVTQCCPDSYHDLVAIHRLNEQLNEISPKRHPIHFYLNQKVYQEIAPYLKPQYKEDRFQLHPLDIYLNSSERETIPLNEELTLHYFSTCSGAKEDEKKCTLGIVLQLPALNIGYISGCAWSPMIPLSLEGCQILCLGVGATNADDYERKKYLPNCLGYNGIRSLLETLNPEIILCTEFAGQWGDIRLEFVEQLRNENLPPAIFPADDGFAYDLKRGLIKSSVEGKLLDPDSVRVTRIHGPYSKLQYLSSYNVI